IVSIAGLIGCATTAGTASPCDLPTPPTTGWMLQDEGAFTLRLPPGYERVEAQGIDSQVGIWEAPGKRISYDLGFYSNPLTPNDVNSFPGMVVCQESEGSGHPRIILYTP